MREILFRGKRIYDGEWIVGQLLRLDDGRVRICESGTAVFSYDLDDSIIQTVAHFVYPETVGQYTYMKDRTGKKVFDGDVIKAFGSDYCGDDVEAIVEVDVTCHDLMWDIEHSNEIVIIGNVHDNPELLGDDDE